MRVAGVQFKAAVAMASLALTGAVAVIARTARGLVAAMQARKAST